MAALRAAVYIRVSSQEQANEGVSLAAQEERCRAYAASQGWAIAQVYIDPGYSGKSLQRPAMHRLLADAPTGVWQIVLVWRLDRLTRRQRDALHILEEVLTPAGVGLKSVTESFDTTTPLGKAMLGMLSVFAQLERETIIERIKLGKGEAHRQGRWGGGPVPYGYQRTAHGQLEPDPAQAPWVRWLYTEAARGVSPDVLAAQLMERGIPGPAGTTWHAQSVRKILLRPIYVGDVARFGDRVAGQHPPLVDRALADQVAEQFDTRRLGPRHPRPQFLVDALLSCPVCGEPLRGQIAPTPKNRSRTSADDPATGHRYYYLCARAKRGAGCTWRYYRAKGIDAQVDAAVRAWCADPASAVTVIDAWHQASPAPSPVVSTLTAEREAIERRIQRWYQAYEAGALDAAELVERVTPLRTTVAALAAQIAATPPTDPTMTRRAAIQRVRRLLREARRQWDTFTPTERQAFVRLLIEGGTVDPETGQVRLILG